MNQIYEGVDFSKDAFTENEYEGCSFRNCEFAEADLSGIAFVECEFENCNFTMAKFDKTALREVAFMDCKLVGVRLDGCNPMLLDIRFKSCQLNLSSFYKLPLQGTVFEACNLAEADFTETDLQEADFQDCVLSGATFDHADLRGADFRTAAGFAIDPEKNRVTGARFAAVGLAGLLGKYDLDIE